MTRDDIVQWIAELRSGKFPQTKGTLKLVDKEGKVEGFCCLGVYAELHPELRQDLLTDDARYEATWAEVDENEFGEPVYGPSHEGSSEIYSRLDRRMGGFWATEEYSDNWLRVKDDVITMNDDGQDFNQIADYLEKKLGELG